MLYRLQSALIAPLSARLAALDRRLDLISKRAAAVDEKLEALLRAQILDGDGEVCATQKLHRARFSIYSQGQEDGILWELQRMAPMPRRFVDIGCGRKAGNCGLLAGELGWSGLFVDINPVGVEQSLQLFPFNDRLAGEAIEVTEENVDAILERHGLAEDLGVLSLDIDSYDYWVFAALRARPAVYVLEYNNRFGGEDAVTVPRGALSEASPKGYHGASLQALTKAAEAKGYRLVMLEPNGVNAFYLREDVAPEIPAIDAGRTFAGIAARLQGRSNRHARAWQEKPLPADLPLERV